MFHIFAQNHENTTRPKIHFKYISYSYYTKFQSFYGSKYGETKQTYEIAVLRLKYGARTRGVFDILIKPEKNKRELNIFYAR